MFFWISIHETIKQKKQYEIIGNNYENTIGIMGNFWEMLEGIFDKKFEYISLKSHL